jgi:hypothetical protein
MTMILIYVIASPEDVSSSATGMMLRDFPVVSLLAMTYIGFARKGIVIRT